MVRAPRKGHHVLRKRAIRRDRAAFEQLTQQKQRSGKCETMRIFRGLSIGIRADDNPLTIQPFKQRISHGDQFLETGFISLVARINSEDRGSVAALLGMAILEQGVGGVDAARIQLNVG